MPAYSRLPLLPPPSRDCTDSNCNAPGGDYWLTNWSTAVGPQAISQVNFFNRLDASGVTGGNGQRSVGAVISLWNALNQTTEQITILNSAGTTTTGTVYGVYQLQFATLPTWPTYPNLTNPVVAQQQIVSSRAARCT